MQSPKKLLGLFFFISYVSVSSADLHKDSRVNPYPFVVSILSKNCISDSYYGTGFIAEHQNVLYLITAAHVAMFMKEESVIRISNSNLSHKTINLIDIVNDSIINWKSHDVADMAILEISKIDAYFENGFKYAVSSEMFIENKERINIGDSFLHVGFPLVIQLAIENNTVFSPYVYITYAVNFIMERPRMDNSDIVSDQISVSPCSYLGSSGGPLISAKCESGNFYLAGINHGFKTAPQYNHPVMSVFTPMYYFFDIVNKQ